MRGDIVSQMTRGIDDSLTSIVFITEMYIRKVAGKGKRGMIDNCKVEFDYAVQRKEGNMISVVMEPSCIDTTTWKGAVGAYLGSKLFYDFTVDTKLETCVDSLVSEIKRRIIEKECRLGGEI